MALGTYNLTKANRLGAAIMYAAKYDFRAAIAADMQLGVRYYSVYPCVSELNAAMDLWWGYDEKYAMAAKVDAQATSHVFISPTYDGEAELTASANPNLPAFYRMAGELTAQAAPRIVITPIWGVLSASLTATVYSVQTKETVMTFESLTIPAGSVLVIDSENCTILLNGKNIIDQYSGDWFYFTRRLLGVDVTSRTSGKPQVSILYRERYL